MPATPTALCFRPTPVRECFPAAAAHCAGRVCQNGFMDYSIHPLEPLAFRLTLAGPIDTIDFPPWPPSPNEQSRPIRRRRQATIQPDFTRRLFRRQLGLKQRHRRQHRDWRSLFHCRQPGNASQWGGGVQLGFDYMLPSRMVLGVAADMSSGGTKTSTVSDASGISAYQTTVFDSETIRGRIGYAADNSCFTRRVVCLVQRSIRPHAVDRDAQQCDGRHDEAVNKGLLGWTARWRHCLRLRAELERLCRISLYGLWNVDGFASVLATDDEFDNDCQFG